MPFVVLIVEDDDDTREMMSTLLRDSGYIATTARNGLEAFRQLDVQTPDLILLDIQMPVMDGWEFRTLQRRDDRYSHIPVIALTAVFDPLEVAFKLGIRCLQKPVDVEEVLVEVHAVRKAAAAGGDRSRRQS